MRIRDLDFNVRTTGTGTAFVWAHGLMSSMATEDQLDWYQWSAFSSNVKLVRYDARGHGKTQATHEPEDYDWRSLGQDMLAVADALGERTFIAGGASMGAATALCAAVLAPSRIQALVLVFPPTIWEKRAPQRQVYQRQALLGGLLGGRLLALLPRSRTQEGLPGWMIKAEPEKYRKPPAALATMSGRTLRSLLRGAADTDLPTRESLVAGVREIPTLILTWVDDPTHPVWSAEELQRHLPKSELFVAKGYDDFKTIPQRMRRFITTSLHYQPPSIHY